MGRLIRILGILLGVLLTLAVLAVVAVLVLVDPDDFREPIQQAVEEATDRSFVMEGPLGLSFIPCCGVSLGPAELGNPEGFPDEPFARVESAVVSARVLPYITSQEIQVSQISVDGLNLNLHVREDGSDNWTFGEESEPADEAPAGETQELGDLNLGELAITNGAVSYRDLAAGGNYLVDQLELSAEDVALGQPFDLSAGVRVVDRDTNDEYNAQFSASVQLEESGAAQASGLSTEITISSAEISPEPVKGALNIATLTYAADGAVTLTDLAADLQATLPDVSPQPVQTEMLVASLNYGADGAVALSGLTGQAQATLPDVSPDALKPEWKVDSLSYGADNRVDVKGTRLEVPELGMRLTVGARGRLADETVLGGSFKIAPFSPRELMAAMNMEAPVTADPDVLKKAELSGRWALRDDAAWTQDLSLVLDDSTITGNVGLSSFETGATRFDLNLDAMDVDRYLPPEGEAEADEAPAESGSEELALEDLRELAISGELNAGKITVAGISLTDFKAVIEGEGGQLALDPLSAQLYGGQIQGAYKIDATGDEALINLQQGIQTIQMGPFLTDLADVENLSGLLNLQFNGTTRGAMADEWLAGLDGDMNFSLADGALEGVDVWYEIRKAVNQIKGKALPEAPADPRTEISSLSASGDIQQGVLDNRDLVMQIPFMRVSGAGQINLAQQDMDYGLSAKVLSRPEFPDGESLDELQGIEIPLNLSGPLESPKVGVDVQTLVKALAGQEAQKLIRDKLGLDEESDEEEDDPLKQGLRKLLGD